MGLANVAGNFRAGKGGRIKWGAASFLFMASWGVDESGIDLPTTNFESFTTALGTTGSGGGRNFTQGLIGPETAACKITGLWNAAQNPFLSPPGIYVREDGPQALMAMNRVDNDFYQFIATRVMKSSVKCDVNGLVTFDFDFMNQGPYVRPKLTFP